MNKVSCTPMVFSPSYQQQGVASILTLTLVGLALTASTLGTAYYLQGRQSQSNTTHAQTSAQINAWAGVHILQQYLEEKFKDAEPAEFEDFLNSKPTLNLQSDQIHGSIKAHLEFENNNNDYLAAKIISTTAEETRAQSSSILEVIFDISSFKKEKNQKDNSPNQCIPAASMVIKTNLNINGGGANFSSKDGLADLIILGDLNISQGKSGFSGCASGNINISGGGIKENSKIFSENGYVKFSGGTTAPINADIWGRDSFIEVWNGTYQSILAGSFSTSVKTGPGKDAITIGSAYTGGKLIKNKFLPDNLYKMQSSPIKIISNQDKNSAWVVDLSNASIDSQTGAVSNIKILSKPANKDIPNLPETIYFWATGVDGGKLEITSAKVLKKVSGNEISLTGEGGSYNSIMYAKKMQMQNQNSINSIVGVGDLTLLHSWPILKLNSADDSYIDGNLIYNIQSNSSIKIPQRDNTPELPGRPYCSANLTAINIENHKSEANYIFEYKNKIPHLTIQNVTDKETQKSIDGIYILNGLENKEKQKILNSLMTCSTRNYDSNNPINCIVNNLTSDYSLKKWNLNGLTEFPNGVIWFDGDIEITPYSPNLVNTILAKGDVTLGNGTGEENKKLKSPGLKRYLDKNNLEKQNKFCETTKYIPNNICNESEIRAKPLFNAAIVTEGNLLSNGWEIFGNIEAGKSISNEANLSTIYGSLSAGNNIKELNYASNLGQGGIEVYTKNMNADELVLANNPNCQNNIGGDQLPDTFNNKKAIIKWSRYL